MDREGREKFAYDEGSVLEISSRWHRRFSHVMESPNTLRKEVFFDELIRSNAKGKKVLDIGCGRGGTSKNVLSQGANFVYGIDISEKEVSIAKQLEEKGRLKFECKSVSQPIEGKYGFIMGRSILHHVDYQEVLLRLYNENLNENGAMVFWEPLGSNILLRLYWLIARNAHTNDERPFYLKDLQWLRHKFPKIEFFPINFLSFIMGIISSKFMANADNLLMRWCDKLDILLENQIKFLMPYYRQIIIFIRK